MYKRIPLKNHHKEILLIAKRSTWGLIFICVLVLFLVLRLMYLQIYKHDVYITLSTKNCLDLVPVEPTRGLIYDRNGVLLAENIPVFSLDLIPNQITNLNKTLAKLNKIISLSPNDILQFKKQVKQHRRFDEIPLKLRLTEIEVARFTENQHRFPGVMIKARLIRHYPFNHSFSHVLGYVGRINIQELNEIDQTNYSASHYIGKVGIEKFYEEDLHGKVGYEEVENDASGKPIRTISTIKSTPGKNIYLTIDSSLQFIAEKALTNHRGAIVIIQPKTGQVLAMVSKPSYDPNAFVVGINHKDYQALQQSEDRPLYNRALRGLYPPASTIKPYFALEGLNSGIITPEDTIIDKGWFQLSNTSHPFHDWIKSGHGEVNVSKAIIESCDIFFYDLASKLGIRRMVSVLTQFGFGSPSGLDLDDELPGVVASPEWKTQTKGIQWYEGDTINAGIGQGFMQVTPIQLAIATATLANRGERFMPYLLLAEQIPGKIHQYQQPTPLEPIILKNNQIWDVIINAMENSVILPKGTAYHFGRSSYSIAGKTGTGQLSKRRNPDEENKQDKLPERLRDHHLFIAFAPINNPKIALAIVTENSNTALNTARYIFDYYLGNQQNVHRQSQTKTQKTSA